MPPKRRSPSRGKNNRRQSRITDAQDPLLGRDRELREHGQIWYRRRDAAPGAGLGKTDDAALARTAGNTRFSLARHACEAAR